MNELNGDLGIVNMGNMVSLGGGRIWFRSAQPHASPISETNLGKEDKDVKFSD